MELSHPEVFSKKGITIFPRIFDISSIIERPTSIYGKTLAIFAGVYDSLTFLLWALAARINLPVIWIIRKERQRQALAIQAVDLWLSSGGGFLNPRYRYELRLYGFFIAFLLRKPVVIFGQSIGPFHNILAETIVKLFLNKASIINVRDSSSYQYVKNLGLKPHLTADIAFLLKESGSSLRLPESQQIVAFCVKRSGLLYRRVVEKEARRLVNQGYFVIFISQTPADDQEVSKLNGAIETNTMKIVFGMSPEKLKSIYGKCEFIISSRMHAIIFAAAQGIPWVGIGYEPKFEGLLRLGRGVLIKEEGLSEDRLKGAIDEARCIKPDSEHPSLTIEKKLAWENFEILKKLVVMGDGSNKRFDIGL